MFPVDPSGVSFYVLGPLRVEIPQQEVRIGGIRRRSVLLRLLASPDRLVPVDLLADDVWDGEPPAGALSTLQSHVSALRQAIGPDRLIFTDGSYRLLVGAGELDSQMFEQDVAAGRAALAARDFESGARALDRALGRWRGQAFADVSAASWSQLPSAHLDELRNAAVEDALEAYLVLGRHHEVCALAEEAVAAEPLRERRWAALMLALYRAGRQADALTAYRRLRDTLAEQLGLDPSPRLSKLETDILLQSRDLDWAGTAPSEPRPIRGTSSTVTAVRGRLPVPVASFVGRKGELAELGKLVGEHRLVTIVGTGGCGKTRLAIEVAASRKDEHRDGVWFVDLAEVSDPAGVAGAAVDALGVPQISGQSAERLLKDRVADLQALLVFDNCEHLIDAAAATIESVLETGAGLRIVATSRQPLRLAGEAIWQTPPISFPAQPHRLNPAELASFDAVRLFIDRASGLETARDVDSDGLRMIAEITARLEGLPLAIELAAARAAQLDLHRLASVLRDRLGLSALGSRTGHARHQTLAATIGWSYDLLTPEMQSAVKRLSVFSGGFSLEAAEAIVGPGPDIAETVASLAERSLITADRSVGPDQPRWAPIRYRMLETIRQYCAQRVADEDGPEGEAAVRDAHSRFFASLTRRASAALTGWHQGRWLTTLEADHANLIAALNHLLDQPSKVGEALQMIVDLDRFWRDRGHLSECAALLGRGLSSGGHSVSDGVRCGALNLAGYAAFRHDLQAARLYLIESLQLARVTRDDFHAAGALWALTYVSYTAGDPEGGSATGKGAVELARAVGDPVLLGECLLNFGLVGDSRARWAISQEALDVTRRSGDRITSAWSHNDLGNLALVVDDLEAARHHLQQARAILREVGHPSPVPVGNLGWVHLRQGNLDLANAAFVEALLGFELLHDRRDSSYVILALACSAAAEREWERAACLFGFADGELEDCGGSWYEPERTYREQSLAEVEGQLGAGFEACYDSGRVGERGDLIDLALGPNIRATTSESPG
jgi:predicted ATPase/DNA-binding SARP family transcriptional activator